MPDSPFLLPRWMNSLRVVVATVALGLPLYAGGLVFFGAAPETIAVGYQPSQPVEFSHALHAGELGMDCRYCHNTVEKAAHAAIPPTQTCLNCHTNIHADSEKLALVRESGRTGEPIPWIRIHDLPDYVYFNHSAHVSKGVACVSCHGRIDRMEVVYQHEPLSMGWCLDCHRRPDANLRPVEEVTNMNWQPPVGGPSKLGADLKVKYNIRSAQELTSCTVCHR